MNSLNYSPVRLCTLLALLACFSDGFVPRVRALRVSLLCTMSAITASSQQHVVIAGAGIIGTCTSYYLAKNYGISSSLVDPTGQIAPAASGKAGGFLARDWNDYAPTGPLTRRSFQLHQELADMLGAASIQYRRLTCVGIGVDGDRHPRGPLKLQGVEWAEKTTGAVRPLGTEDTIAQVHPKLLCERLWKETQALASKGKVVGTRHNDDGDLQGAALDDGSVVPADAVLYACGPWTADVMLGVKYHSAVIPTDQVLSQCVFFSGCGDPEVYVRPDSTAYCTGFPEDARFVTEEPGQEMVQPEKINTIVQAVRKASSGSSNGGALNKKPILEQACYLPTTTDGVPIMGELSEEAAGGRGCFICTGHSCWGILMGPASGESMASLIATGKSEKVDLSAFQPARYRTIQLAPQITTQE